MMMILVSYIGTVTILKQNPLMESTLTVCIIQGVFIAGLLL